MDIIRSILFLSICCIVLYGLYILTVMWFNYERQVSQEKPYRIIAVLLVLAVVFLALFFCLFYLEKLLFGREVAGGLLVLKIAFKCILGLLIYFASRKLFQKKPSEPNKSSA